MQKSFNNWDKIGKSIKPAAKQVVRKVAFDIQAQAQVRAPVDTGFLKNSIYVVTSDSSSYKGGANALPEIARPSIETEAAVAVGANYGIHVEYGTVHQPPQPYFRPAVEAVRPSFDKAMLLLKQKMEEAAK